MKKSKKIVMSVILTLFLIYIFTPFSLARVDAGGAGGTAGHSTVGDIVGGADGFLEEGAAKDSPLNDDALKQGSSILYNVLLIVGTGVAVIWGLVLGIQFVTGSVEAKADIKKNLIAYVFGCVIIFGAFGIWKLVVEILGEVV